MLLTDVVVTVVVFVMGKNFIARGFDSKFLQLHNFVKRVNREDANGQLLDTKNSDIEVLEKPADLSYSQSRTDITNDGNYDDYGTESVLLVKTLSKTADDVSQTDITYKTFFPELPHVTGPQIFSNPSGRRRYVIKIVGYFFLFLAILWSILFIQSLTTPHLIHDGLGNQIKSLKHVLNYNENLYNKNIDPATKDPVIEKLYPNDLTSCGSSPLLNPVSDDAPNKIQRRVFGFLPSAPDWAHLSLKGDCDVVNVLMADWFEVNAIKPTLIRTVTDTAILNAVDNYIAKQNTDRQLFPVITIQDQKTFTRLATADYSDQFILNIDQVVSSTHASGICIQSNPITKQNIKQLGQLLNKLNEKLKLSDIQTCVIINQNTLNGSTAETFLAADYVIVKMFRENWVGSSPSPLAGYESFRDQLINVTQKLNPDKLVVAIGNFATDWISGQPIPEVIGYSEAISRITKSGANISYSPTALNSFSSFIDEEGQRHQIWMLDAISAFNELSLLDELGVKNVGIWSMGLEDPSLWPLLKSQGVDTSAIDKVLNNVLIENTVNYEGSGTFLKFISKVKKGVRELTFSDDGKKIIQQKYTELPRATVIKKYGASKFTQVALTFDDGPNRQFTPSILDTLKDKNVPATFFVVGENMLREPDLVKRIYDEGHEIGSHTFWHPKMDEISNARSLFELNSVQKILINTINHKTKLFREPFLRSQGPFSVKEAEATQIAQSQGYIIAGSDIVPPDWTGISAKEIEEFVVGKVTSNKGNVVLMHDGGNDRSQTVAALPIIIDRLRNKGYEIVSLSEILGVERNITMPPATNEQDIVSHLTFRFASTIWDVLNFIFWLVIFFGVVRSVAILILAKLRHPPRLNPDYHLPDVTVIIPAFNEEKVVQNCLLSVLKSDYPRFKVIVVDDGSNDETLHEVLRKISDRSDVQLICQLNHGKWRALNAAYSVIDTEIAVSIDADTRIEPDTIKKLVRHFHDPKIGAVAGKVVVGNRTNMLSKLQALEYIVAQNIDRRAAELFNGILVVPGAVGAWRVSAVREAGLYSGVTQTEDADLTISLNRSGYKVAHEPLAIGTTEAPTTIKSLSTQRLRWSLGMLQNSWKHRGAMLKLGFLGQIALPDLLIYGYLFAVLAPIADLYFFILIFNAISSMITSNISVMEIGNPALIGAYLVLPLLDAITAFMAIRNDKPESYWLLLLLPLQRLLYRQLLYIAVFRAAFRACTGQATKWGKLERTGRLRTSNEARQ